MSHASRDFHAKVQRVYLAAQLLGKPLTDYSKAQRIADRFTLDELDRIMRRVVARNGVKKRLTLVK